MLSLPSSRIRQAQHSGSEHSAPLKLHFNRVPWNLLISLPPLPAACRGGGAEEKTSSFTSVKRTTCPLWPMASKKTRTWDPSPPVHGPTADIRLQTFGRRSAMKLLIKAPWSLNPNAAVGTLSTHLTQQLIRNQSEGGLLTTQPHHCQGFAPPCSLVYSMDRRMGHSGGTSLQKRKRPPSLDSAFPLHLRPSPIHKKSECTPLSVNAFSVCKAVFCVSCVDPAPMSSLCLAL
mmetsp:Transcript_37597/g.107400  ORF Transcript_37597/g.107400 Transcript_37597/m.107400 type:complete len:232 (-) Transcript_37597:1185-1880(-)